MKKLKRIQPVVAALTLIVTLVSSSPAQANTARALIDLLRTPGGWTLLTRTPEGMEYATRTLGHQITKMDDLDLLVTRLSEREQVASLERFCKATDRIPSTIGLDNLTYLKRIAREELKLADSLDELVFVKSKPASSFSSNSRRFMEAGNEVRTAESGATLDLPTFRSQVYMTRGTLSMDAPRAQQLEAVRTLGNLKLERKAMEALNADETYQVILQPLEDLKKIILTSSDDVIRNAAMGAFIQYGRFHSPGQYSYQGKMILEAFEDIYLNTDIPDWIRRSAFDEIRVTYGSRRHPKGWDRVDAGEFKTARALLEENALRAQQLEAIYRLGNLKLDRKAMEALSARERYRVILQPLEDLKEIILTSSDDMIRNAAMGAFIQYGRFHSPGYKYGYQGKWILETLDDIYLNTDIPDWIRRSAFDEIRVTYGSSSGWFKTARELIEEKALSAR